MNKNIDTRLHEATARKLRLESTHSRLRSSKAEQKRQQRLHGKLKQALLKERKDVKRLEGMGLTAFYHSIVGSKDRQLKKERQEVAEASLRLNAAHEELHALDLEITCLEDEVTSLGDPARDYKMALEDKAKQVRAGGGQRAKQLATIAEKRAEYGEEIRELKEAERAAKNTISALQRLLAHLEKARNMGGWDMMGGGWVASSLKHDHLDRAAATARNAQKSMRKLKRELQDVGETAKLKVRLHEFSRFADMFFDCFLVDWTVQTKINQSHTRMVRTLGKVKSIQAKLKNRRITSEKGLEELKSRRRALLEK